MPKLCLSRSSGQSVFIGNNKEVTISVKSINKNQVQLHIYAEKNVPIYRDEIYDKYKDQYKDQYSNSKSIF
jgi:carbon storage regulator CsrA